VGRESWRLGGCAAVELQRRRLREQRQLRAHRARLLLGGQDLHGELAAADLNRDGWVDMRDIQMHMQGGGSAGLGD
jgi:hypothetical protein